MAGMFLLGVPVLGGVVGGTGLQLAMRSSGFGIESRVAVELAFVVFGVFNIWRRPPGSAKDCKNWDLFMANGALVASGVVAMAEGVLINVARRDDVVLTCLGALGLYGAWRLVKRFYVCCE
mmetsp:Transcript_34687/g.117595  ORF Transcript_34687/g.117595 Transcript_34687/m.117595 type:complete len:121 (-) Transcript_34687:66-428(-)